MVSTFIPPHGLHERVEQMAGHTTTGFGKNWYEGGMKLTVFSSLNGSGEIVFSHDKQPGSELRFDTRIPNRNSGFYHVVDQEFLINSPTSERNNLYTVLYISDLSVDLRNWIKKYDDYYQYHSQLSVLCFNKQ